MIEADNSFFCFPLFFHQTTATHTHTTKDNNSRSRQMWWLPFFFFFFGFNVSLWHPVHRERLQDRQDNGLTFPSLSSTDKRVCARSKLFDLFFGSLDKYRLWFFSHLPYSILFSSEFQTSITAKLFNVFSLWVVAVIWSKSICLLRLFGLTSCRYISAAGWSRRVFNARSASHERADTVIE